MNVIEKVARAICLERMVAMESDLGVIQTQVNKQWKHHIKEAKAAVQSLIDSEWPIYKSMYACGVDEAKAMLQSILDGSK